MNHPLETQDPRTSRSESLPVFLTPKEAAAALRLCEKTIYRWLWSGYLRARRKGGRWHIAEEDLRPS